MSNIKLFKSNLKKNLIFLLSLILFFNISKAEINNIPKLTVVMVIDQFAYHYIQRMGKNFNFGIKELQEKGINYTNAHHPHGTPATATGHNALNTGTFAKHHGIILNTWGLQGNKKMRYDQDNSSESLVFGPHGLQKYGNSTKNIMTGGLTDRFVEKYPEYKTFSLSHKSRAAIGMAGKRGKPIWFDENTGEFTTSKAFFKQMPKWVSKFNKTHNVRKKMGNKYWDLLYPANSKYYDLTGITFHMDTNYTYATYDESLISNKPLSVTTFNIDKKKKGKNKLFDRYLKTPDSNKLLLSLGKECVNQNVRKNNKMLLWISLSTLDKLGHVYGPHSVETVDMIYHLDKQIKTFMDYVKAKIGEENVLFVLTADHGVQPIVEYSQHRGFDAHRINTKKIISNINNQIQAKFGINQIANRFKSSQLYLSKNRIQNLNINLKNKILNEIKKIILRENGVDRVYTSKELTNNEFKFNSIENFYKQQIYPGRSGDIICIPNKHSIFTNYKDGAGHASGHKYNTHVPLIIYQKGRFENKIINEKVWMPQLPVTIAKILKTQKPESSEFEVLPFD